MANSSKLFQEFEPVSKETWKEVAIADLKGADFDKKLVWKTDEGIDVQPFYAEEDIKSLHAASFQPDGTERKWTNFIEVDARHQKEANERMLKFSQFDVKGVLLKIDEPNKVDFYALLKDIDLSQLNLGFKVSSPSPILVHKYFDYLSEQKLNINDISGFVQSDVLEEWSVTGQKPDFKLLAEQLKITSQAGKFKGLMLSSHSFINAGSGIVQELAFTLNKLTDFIEELGKEGLSPQNVINEIAFHLSIGGDYFFEMAKLRAFRRIVPVILNCYTESIPEIFVLSSNSTWSKSLYDPNVNMLRNTTEAMSAIIGGCDGILIQPHDSTYKSPDQFSQRIALNISNLLKEESYFDKVADPGAGSYYIESITSRIAEKSLQLFKKTEADGGYVKSFREGKIQDQINSLKDRKESEISTRKRIYVGTNKYPDLNEKIDSKVYSKQNKYPSDIQLLKPQRSTKNFDDLRQRTQRYFEETGSIPKVYLACYGNLAMRKARAAFASEFFGTAGFEILGEFFNDDAGKLSEQSAKSDAEIVVICSSDPEYEAGGKAFAEEFRKINKQKKLILAGFPSEVVDDLKQAGVDDFIHIKTNVIEFITNIQNELFAKH